MITLDQLSAICQHAHTQLLANFEEPLNAAMAEFEINSRQREQYFIAQVAHESSEFQHVRELWGPTPAQAGYEGRADLGNTQSGDGFRYRGRGLLQITGRANNDACGHALGLPLIEHPELLELPLNACRSAAWFWAIYKKLNPIADAGDFLKVTHRINGGENGLADRQMYLERARRVLV